MTLDAYKHLISHVSLNEISEAGLPGVFAAIEAAIAAERAEADRRVEEAKKLSDRYREMLVGAILRSARRSYPLETQAMNAAPAAG